MAQFVSSWSKTVTAVPENYILPLDKRPQLDVPICKEIPVIDLSSLAKKGSAEVDDQAAKVVADQMIKALEEFMAFQVINHGIPDQVMEDAMDIYKEFFNLPEKEKEKYVTHGITDEKLSVGDYTREQNYCWKDSMGHECNPVEETIETWPEKPARYREVIEKYAVGTKKLSDKILELIAERLGMGKGYFAGELTQVQTLVVNSYPKCPDPHLTFGQMAHHDSNALTLIQQNVSGLQILRDGTWVAVQPLPNAFLVINGYELEIISNGRFKSAVHRIVTNAESDRISIVVFINSSDQAIVEPAKPLLNDENLPKFKTFIGSDQFEKNVGKKEAAGESTLAAQESEFATFQL